MNKVDNEIESFIYSDDFQDFVDYVDLKFREQNIFETWMHPAFQNEDTSYS